MLSVRPKSLSKARYRQTGSSPSTLHSCESSVPNIMKFSLCWSTLMYQKSVGIFMIWLSSKTPEAQICATSLTTTFFLLSCFCFDSSFMNSLLVSNVSPVSIGGAYTCVSLVSWTEKSALTSISTKVCFEQLEFLKLLAIAAIYELASYSYNITPK